MGTRNRKNTNCAVRRDTGNASHIPQGTRQMRWRDDTPRRDRRSGRWRGRSTAGSPAVALGERARDHGCDEQKGDVGKHSGLTCFFLFSREVGVRGKRESFQNRGWVEQGERNLYNE